jgi:predicted  nucleic acid-binding Zn-ribbon protein
MNLRQLSQLQEEDNHILRLKAEIAEIPRQIELQKAKLNQIAKENQAVEGVLQTLLKEKHALELELKSKEEHRVKLQSQQFAVKTNELFKSIQQEIAEMGKVISLIEDKILENMEASEKAKKDIEIQKAAYLQEKQRFTEIENKLLAEQARLDNLIKGAQAARDDKYAQLPPKLRSVYDRVRLKHPENAIVTIQNDTCQGCFMKLPAQVTPEVRKGDKIIQCENCSRILYYIEDNNAL